MPPLADVGVNTTVVPGQNEPDGLALMDTVGVTGADTDNDANTVPEDPVVMPATPVTALARTDPAVALVVNGCTCRPVIVSWSAPLLFTTVTFTVRAVAVMLPDTPVMLEPVI